MMRLNPSRYAPTATASPASTYFCRIPRYWIASFSWNWNRSSSRRYELSNPEAIRNRKYPGAIAPRNTAAVKKHSVTAAHHISTPRLD